MRQDPCLHRVYNVGGGEEKDKSVNTKSSGFLCGFHVIGKVAEVREPAQINKVAFRVNIRGC